MRIFRTVLARDFVLVLCSVAALVTDWTFILPPYADASTYWVEWLLFDASTGDEAVRAFLSSPGPRRLWAHGDGSRNCFFFQMTEYGLTS